MHITDGRYLAEMFFNDFDGAELAYITEDFVNSFTFDKEGFISYMVEQEDKSVILDMAFLWIANLKCKKDNGWYDLRNEAAVIVGAEIYEIFKDEIEAIMQFYNYNGAYLDEDYNYAEIVYFVHHLGNAHRTLQQSFSSMIFELLSILSETSYRLISLGEYWKLPLI